MPKDRTRDMTVGAPMPILLSFILPLLLGLLFQQFYAMVDTVVVGNFLGMEALAGVGSTGSINFLVLGLCNGVCAGFAIPVAQKFGEKDFNGLRNFVGNMIWLGGIIALIVTAVTTIGCRAILTAMNTPESTFSYAYDYIFLIFLGIPATMLYNLLSGILRSLGDSRTPLMFLVFSSLLNVALDIVCVVTLQMGVAGAGWATLISQLISGLLCLLYMDRKFPILHLKKENLLWRGHCVRRLLIMGLPMGLQYSITAIGSILLQTAVNGLGAVSMAAVAASGKVTNLFATPYDAMGTMAATYAGQNLGAGKLDRVRTGDTLCDASRVVKLPAPVFPQPSLFMAVTVAKKGDEGKISSALARLMEEDPTLSYQNNAETHQQVIGGLGEQHLDVVKAKLKNKFGVEIGLEAPRIAYRESIRKACQKQGRHKKQTGGHGQFGDVIINFEPCDSEQVVFEEKVFGGSVPKNFFPAVEKGVRLAAEKGVLAGYPVVGLKATLLDGSYHPVDSSEMAFIMAAKLAYKAAMPEAGPVILEPIHTLKAHVPNDNTGDIMGDVTKRRGRVLGMEPDEDGLQTIIAEVPLAELANFTTFIRQTTQGRGWFTTEFARYEVLPEMLVPAVVEQAKKLGNLDESADD